MSDYISILFYLVIMGMFLFVCTYLFSFLIKYKITDKDIKILLFNFILIYKIPFEKIIKISSIPFYETIFTPGLHFLKYIFARRVVIEMKDTWFRYVFLTPKDIDGFIKNVKNKL